jgi:hypothetical protein
MIEIGPLVLTATHNIAQEREMAANPQVQSAEDSSAATGAAA